MIAYCLITRTKVDIGEIIYSDRVTGSRPADKGLPSTISDEGTSKTKPLPKGPHRDKDSEGFKPPNDMEPSTTHVGDLSRTDVKYQADIEETQSPKPSKDSSTEIPSEEPVSKEHQPPSPHKKQPESSHAKDTYVSDSEFSSCSETFRSYDNFIPITKMHEEVAASYADLRDSIEDYYEENVDHRAQTDKLVQETMSTLDKISKAGIDERAKLLKSLNRVSETLEAEFALKEEINKMVESHNTTSGNLSSLTKLLYNVRLPEILTKLDVFQSILNTLSTQCASISKSLKKEPEFNQRLLRVAEGYIQNSVRLTKIANSLQAINLLSFHQRITNIKNTQITMQVDISSIKGMTTKMIQTFKKMISSTPSGSASIPTATQPKVHASVGGNLEKQVVVWQKPPSYTEGELLLTEEVPARVVPISTVIPLTRPDPELEMMSSLSIIRLTDTLLEVPVHKPITQAIGLVIDITPPEQPKSPQVALRAVRGKGIATDDIEPPIKLITASSEVRPEPNEPVKVPYEIHGKLYDLTNDEIQEHLDREEKIKKASEEAKLLAMSKHELIKVVHKEALNIRIDLKKALLKGQESNEAKKEKIFGDFRITKLDELGPIIETKKNKNVGELVISLRKIYERLKKIRKELGIQSALAAPSQAQSQSSGRKRKHMELEPKIRIPGLECNRSLPGGVPFFNNMVIKEPEYEMFFIDVFGYEAFQRMNDMHKVDIETLLTYLVMASNINTPKNQRFCLKLRELIGKHLEQEKLKSKRVKLEALGYKLTEYFHVILYCLLL
ncbi:hypothetical protein Tco_0523789 [Tanacetum coccineum]